MSGYVSERGIPVGALDGTPPRFVDRFGAITAPASTLLIDWCVIGEDSFHDPRVAPTLRQLPCDGAVVDTALRIVGGDVLQRVYAVGGDTIVEFENATPAACAVALVVVGDPQLVRPARDPSQWCRGIDADDVRAQLGRNETQAMPVGPGDGALGLVWPLAHRATLRIAVGSGDAPVAALAGADDVRRGWMHQLRRGMHVDLDDPVLRGAIDAARIAAIVCAPVADAGLVRALEDWGFEAEAATAWEGLNVRERRGLRRRRADPMSAWTRLQAALEVGDQVGVLNGFHDVAIDDRGDTVDVFSGFPAAWLGVGIALHDVPLRRATLSIALRWHADRPALLWEFDGDVTLRSPQLDPAWSTRERSGEVLLAAPTGTLLDH
jgi:hypothetical protein